MAGEGKWEAEIKIDSASIATFTDDSANDETCSLVVGDLFYISSANSTANDLLAEIEADINDASGIGGGGDTIALSINSDGKTVITFSGASGEVEWNNTVIRDMLGFTGDLTGAATYTSTNACQALWLPDSQYQSLNGQKSGWWEFDDQELESPGGQVFQINGEKKKINEVTYVALSRAKTWAENEANTNESWESFLLNGVRKGKGWATGRLRWYPDETDDATYFTYKLNKGAEYKPAQIKRNWTGGWSVTIGRLIRDPSE